MKKILIAAGLIWASISVQAQEKPANLLTPTEYAAKQKQQKGVLLDVRTPEEFTQGHLKQAKNVDYKSGEFAQKMASWDKNKTYYLYCASGNRSGKALKLMQDAGFQNVYNLGGYKDLETAGLKVEKPKK